MMRTSLLNFSDLDLKKLINAAKAIRFLFNFIQKPTRTLNGKCSLLDVSEQFTVGSNVSHLSVEVMGLVRCDYYLC